MIIPVRCFSCGKVRISFFFTKDEVTMGTNSWGKTGRRRPLGAVYPAYCWEGSEWPWHGWWVRNPPLIPCAFHAAVFKLDEFAILISTAMPWTSSVSDDTAAAVWWWPMSTSSRSSWSKTACTPSHLPYLLTHIPQVESSHTSYSSHFHHFQDNPH